ncbi:MAG: endolytic transglycosylase MltG [Bryobacteraceae bacterium]|nr:endolytic transglycosylase MltG [Bryobacteraceae bacterium]MDW8379331.1 endolytic transglycosylase MltG [Bryobacterales bacterium]
MARWLLSRKRWMLAALLLGAAGGLLSWLAVTLVQPYAGFDGQAILNFPRGSSTNQIAAQLQQAGVIRWRWQLWAARLLRPKTALQAGEYRFDEPASPLQIYDRLARGDTFYYELTVPEGANMYEIASLLDQGGIIRGYDFLQAAANPNEIRDLAPEAPSLEGYLFPATYRLSRQTTAAELVRRMTDRFRRAWKSLRTSEDVHRIVTLASLVEKEAVRSEERPLIASVFRNRLDRGMKLDCDPTTIYAALLEGRYRGSIYRSDLASQNPYNTYQHAGLPPGPIANPGLKSLEAALRPANTNYLYFVATADGSGAHIFSSTIEAHQKAVAQYRRADKKRKKESPITSSARSRAPGRD